MFTCYDHLPVMPYASVNWVGIGSGNGFSTVRRQTINWTSVDLLSIGSLGTNSGKNLYRNSSIFIEENAFENIVSEMAAILSRL